MARYNVLYDTPDGSRFYQMMDSRKETAEQSLALFKSRYLNADGTPKRYPNGKGTYGFTNPRVVERNDR